MTVQNTIVKNIYKGNGSTTVFPYTFALIKNEHIKVYITDKNGKTVETSDFTVGDGSITYPKNGVVLAEGEKLTVIRELPLHQVLNLLNQGPFYAQDIELTFDEVVMMLQQINERLGRSLCIDVSLDSETDFDPTVPLTPGKTIKISNDGTHFENTEDPAVIYPLCVAEQQEATMQAGIATERAAAAKVSEDNAKASEIAADDSEAKALAYKNAAAQSASEAAISKDGAVNAYNAAAASAANAKASEERALAYKDLTQKAKETAVHNANLAIDSASAASESEANAKDYMLGADASALNAGNSAIDAAEQASYAQKMAQYADASKLAAGESEMHAKASEEESARILEEVKNSEANAMSSKIAAANSAADAKSSADLAKNFTPEGYQILVDKVNNTLALPFVVQNGKVYLKWRKEVDPLE